MSIAAIIPALDEADRIGALIAALIAQGVNEVIVAYGGSADETRSLACAAGAKIVQTRRSRGVQIAAGARAATADILWILHADSAPPPGAISFINAAMADAGVAMGCFPIAFDARHPMLQFYAFASRFDCAFSTFGDQGYFMRRRDYEAAGGAPEWSLMEDVELRRRMRRFGRVAKAKIPIKTSARRYLEFGPLRTQLMNAFLLARFYAGEAPESLAESYYKDCRNRH